MGLRRPNLGWRVAHVVCAVAGSAAGYLERLVHPASAAAATLVVTGAAWIASAYCGGRGGWTVIDWYAIRAGKLVWRWDEDTARSFARGCFWAAGVGFVAFGIYRLVVAVA